MDNPGYEQTSKLPPLSDTKNTKSRDLSSNQLELNSNGELNGGKSVGQPSNGKVGVQADDTAADDTKADDEANRTFHDPFFYARWIVKYPKTCFFVTLGLHLFMLFIVVVLMVGGVNIVPIVFEQLPLDLKDNTEFLKGLAWSSRDDNKIIEDKSATGDEQVERTEFFEAIEWHFELPGGNLLKKTHLKEMEKVEHKLWNEDKFQSSFCMTEDGSTCLLPTSVIRLFDGTFSGVNSTFDDPNYNNIASVLYLATQYSATNPIIEYALGSDAKIRSNKAEVSIVRGRMSVGSPLDGYDSFDKKVTEQEDELKAYYRDTFIPLAEEYYKNGAGDMDFVYVSGTMIGVYITDTVYRDIALAFGSLLFIFCFMWFQTRSLFVAGFGIFSIMNGFIITDVIYIGILRVEYLGIFHVLSLFIVLGIGADDIFVFTDTWKEAGHKSWPSLEHRLDHTFRHAGVAMLYTSLTTALAFFVSAASPFLAIYSFGIFSGILVIINYLSVVIFFPNCVVMHELYFKKYKCCCCCPGKEETEVGAKKNMFVRFFAGPYYRFITHKIIRWVILGAFAVLTAVLIYFATTLEVQEEQLKFLPDSTNVGAYLINDAEKFGTGEFPQRVFIVWGLKEQDISECSASSTDCAGDTVFNSKFKIKNENTQQQLRDFCDDIMNLPNSKLKELKIKVNSVTNEPEVNCFVEEMAQFLDVEEGRTVWDPANGTDTLRYDVGTDLTYPIDEIVATTIMDNVSYIYYENGQLPGGFSKWFEIGMQHWLYDGFQLDNTTNQVVLGEQYHYYSPLLGVSADNAVSYNNSNDYLYFPLKYGTRLRYAAITVNLSINPQTLGFPTGLGYRDAWEDWVTKKLEDMPSALKDGFQCTPVDYYGFNLWHWLYVQQQLTVFAGQGIMIGLCLAFPILVVATMNVIVGLLATITIGLVTLAVIAFIPILGWKLGVLESLNLVLVVGLSVDYSVHLAEGYGRCKKPDRLSRVQSALEEVGISVLSGCATTLGASFFLMLAVIIFFVKFGIFMFVTIGFSLLYSLLFFMTLLGVIGPQNNFGSIRPLFDKIKACCCRKKQDQDIAA